MQALDYDEFIDTSHEIHDDIRLRIECSLL